MTLRTLRIALAVALVVNVVLAILLSPLGFETRPQSALTPFGIVAIVTVGVGVLLDLAAVILIWRRASTGSTLAIAGSIVLLFPNVVDKAGAFFSAPAPSVVAALEWVFLAVLAVTLALAWSVRRTAADA